MSIHSESPPEPESLLAGTYSIEKKLGEGGLGVVYQCTNVNIGRKVAIKLLHPELAHEEKIVERFYREARACSRVGHEHIIDVIDMGTLDTGANYIVMELLEGRELKEAFTTSELDLGRLIRIVLQVCEALEATHAKGIVHRDLKPENIFLITRQGNPHYVKVLDFGIAKFLELDPKTGLTTTGAVLGTPHYMSPEQAKGEKTIDQRSDLFSLGSILYRGLTGKHAFEGTSVIAVLTAICIDTPLPLRHHRPELPEELEAVVEKLLAKNINERFMSCSEVIEALKPFAELEQPLGETTPTSPPPEEPSERSRDRLAPVQNGTTEKHTPKAFPRKALLLGLPLAALLVIGGLFLVPSAREREREPLQTAGLEVSSTDSTTPNHLEVPAQSVSVRIETVPRSAELFLDGNPIANPFDATLTPESTPRRLEAKLAGYRPLSKRITLNDSQTIRFVLEAIEEPTPAKTSPPGSGTARVSRQAPRTKTETTESEPETRTPQKASPPSESIRVETRDPLELKRVTF